MKLYNLIILSTFFFSICVDKFPLDNDVITLTDFSYEKALNQYQYLMIYFYAHGVATVNHLIHSIKKQPKF